MIIENSPSKEVKERLKVRTGFENMTGFDNLAVIVL